MTKRSNLTVGQRRCRICGCAEFAACTYIGAHGRTNCYWITPNLCSHPRCIERASWAALLEGVSCAGVGAGIWSGLVLTETAPAFAVLALALAAMCAWWWATLRHARICGACSNPLGRPADWVFWAAIVALFSLAAAGWEVADRRWPAERARAQALGLIEPAPPVGGGR